MKKFISIVLCLVLVFSFSIPSFAIGDNDTELEALNSIDYYVFWTFTDFTRYFSDLLEDSGIIRTNLISAVDYLNISQLNLSDIASYNFNMLGELQKLNQNLFGTGTVWLQSFGGTVVSSLSNISGGLQSLVNVFADPADLKLRDNQENNLISATDNFFSPGSGTSIETEDISGLAGIVSDFNSVFDVSTIVGDENPLDILNSKSDFSKWFSTETGLSMDPKFGSGSGGSGELIPPPESESPYQGENLLPYATSNLVTDTVYNGKGFKNYVAFAPFGSGRPYPENDVYSDSFSTTGYIEVDDGDTLYLYNFNFIDCTTAVFYSQSYDRNEIYSVIRLDYSEVNLPDVVDENGVFSITFEDSESHPVVAFRFQSSLITSASIITKNVYPLKGLEPEPDPEPIQTNWLPLATSTQGGSDVYNGKGWKENVRLSSGGSETSASGFYTTGFIPVSAGDVVYTKNILFSAVNGVSSRFYLYEDGSVTYNSVSNASMDSLGVFTFNIPNDVVAVRFVGSSMSDSSIITINQYPSVDAVEPVSYSLRSSVSLSAPEISYSDEVVTSYYQDRMNEFYSLLGGDE